MENKIFKFINDVIDNKNASLLLELFKQIKEGGKKLLIQNDDFGEPVLHSLLYYFTSKDGEDFYKKNEDTIVNELMEIFSSVSLDVFSYTDDNYDTIFHVLFHYETFNNLSKKVIKFLEENRLSVDVNTFDCINQISDINKTPLDEAIRVSNDEIILLLTKSKLHFERAEHSDYTFDKFGLSRTEIRSVVSSLKIAVIKNTAIKEESKSVLKKILSDERISSCVFGANYISPGKYDKLIALCNADDKNVEKTESVTV